MSTPVQTMEAANLFCGKDPKDVSVSNHLVLTEIKLPALDEVYVDHRAGGAPVAIEIDTVINKLESTFILLGWTPSVAALAASWERNQNHFYMYGVIRDRQSGDIIQAIAHLIGRLGKTDPQNWRRGDVMHWNYALKGIVHYELSIGGQPMYYWDFFTNDLRIGGVPRNDQINTALGIPAAPATIGIDLGVVAPANAGGVIGG
jgi:P2 family phage contractile tail tube protein